MTVWRGSFIEKKKEPHSEIFHLMLNDIVEQRSLVAIWCCDPVIFTFPSVSFVWFCLGAGPVVSHVFRGSFLFPSYRGSAHVSCQWGRAGSRWLPTEEGVLESSERATDGKAYMPLSPLSLPTVPWLTVGRFWPHPGWGWIEDHGWEWGSWRIEKVGPAYRKSNSTKIRIYM